MPTVSVIVPNYNHARFLPKRIESVLGQTYRDFELILLDDCSTDESRTILSKHANDPRVRIKFNEANSGSTFKQWNKGVRLATGKYVWIAESDDYADPRLLERLVPVLDSDARIGFVYCRSWSVTEDDRLTELVMPDVPRTALPRWETDHCSNGAEDCRLHFVRTNIVPNASAVVFRRAVYDLVGGADENFRLCGDWKFWAAAALQGKIAYVSEPLNYFRMHAGSVRVKNERDMRDLCERLQVMNWILERVPAARPTIRRLRAGLADQWVPAMFGSRASPDVRRSVMREVRLLDPFPVPRMIVPIFTMVRLKIRRHWRQLTGYSAASEQSAAAAQRSSQISK